MGQASRHAEKSKGTSLSDRALLERNTRPPTFQSGLRRFGKKTRYFPPCSRRSEAFAGAIGAEWKRCPAGPPVGFCRATVCAVQGIDDNAFLNLRGFSDVGIGNGLPRDFSEHRIDGLFFAQLIEEGFVRRPDIAQGNGQEIPKGFDRRVSDFKRLRHDIREHLQGFDFGEFQEAGKDVAKGVFIAIAPNERRILAALDMIPLREISPLVHDNDVGPALGLECLDPLCEGFALTFPKSGGVCEDSILAEKIGQDFSGIAVILVQIEKRLVG